MYKVLIILGVLVLAAGCRTQCPTVQTIEVSRVLTDTVYMAFPDELTLNELAYCDSVGIVRLASNIKMRGIIDSLKNLPIPVKIISKYVYKESKRDTIIKPYVKIVYKETTSSFMEQLKWVIIAAIGLFLLVFIFKK